MVSILILILYSIQNTCAEDTLKVLDCTQPTNIHILENSECHFQPEKNNQFPIVTTTEDPHQKIYWVRVLIEGFHLDRILRRL